MEASVISSVTIEASHRCFDGHFEDRKIFPAVAQISMCLKMLESAAKGKKAVFRAAKFMQPITPGIKVDMHSREKGQKTIIVDLKTDLNIYSRIEFALEDIC